MLLLNAVIATMESNKPYGLIERGALVLKGSKIAWVGDQNDLPKEFSGMDSVDLEGRLVTPALIDCHTHIVYGGNRANEFEMRLNGASYQEVSEAGGGIVSTVTNTREASEEELLTGALKRADALIAEGTTLIEIESGYGLDVDTEIKMLRVAREIQLKRDIRVKTSFLGAHAVPKEFKGNADKYIDEICLPALDKAFNEGLVDTVDGLSLIHI